MTREGAVIRQSSYSIIFIQYIVVNVRKSWSVVIVIVDDVLGVYYCFCCWSINTHLLQFVVINNVLVGGTGLGEGVQLVHVVHVSPQRRQVALQRGEGSLIFI